METNLQNRLWIGNKEYYAVNFFYVCKVIVVK